MVGNPNVGKTAILNALTGGKFQVGNFPGTTVEIKEGKAVINGVEVEFIDLPGIYSMKPYSADEEIAVKFLLEGKYDVILNVVDSSNIERNLYLTLQLCSTNKPIVLVLNMLDEAQKKGFLVNSKKLSQILGVPVVETVAVKNEGIEKLKEEIFRAKNCKIRVKTVEEAVKLAEKIVEEVVERKRPIKEFDLDEVFTDPFLGMLIFISAMWMLFKFTYQVADPFVGIIDLAVNVLVKELSSYNSVIFSLLGRGVIKGVGSVLIFVPNIAFLFMGLAFMELSGYMARAVFLMDKLMSKLKLTGRSAIPMIMGFGCNVPAIMATRSIEDRKVRMATLLSIPFISCSARLPIYVLLAGAFFSNPGEIVMLMYFVSVFFSLLTAYLLRSTVFKGEAEFIMEMPPYRLPCLRDVLVNTWLGVKHFLEKAGTIILAMSILLWFITSYPSKENSYALILGNAIKPLFSPMGWSSSVVVAIIAGLVAKEVVVETLSVTTPDLHSVLTPAQAIALMVFTLLYMPCVAAMGVIKSETGSWKWVAFSIVFSFLVAYATSLMFLELAKMVIA